MSNLMFCLNATMPIFLTMMLGYAFRKWHIMDGSFVDKMNSFVFKVALPVLVFQDLATVDFFEAWDWKFVVFCFLATLISITAVTLLYFQKIEPSGQCKCTEQRRQHDNTGSEHAFMPHISCHNIGTDRCRRAEHHKDRDQLFRPKTKCHCDRQKYARQDHQL